MERRQGCAYAYGMQVGPYIGCAVLAMVFASAMLGMLIRRKLPESHLGEETKGVITLAMGVVGTLTAFLSLLIATASGTCFGLFAPPNATVTVALFLCALAAAGAIQTILDLSRPFEGVVRVSAQPLRHALEVVDHGLEAPERSVE